MSSVAATSIPDDVRRAPCRLGIVVPCYNEEDVLPETAVRLTALIERLIAERRITNSSRVYFVDDGSGDGTWGLIERLAENHESIAGIKLSRNRGHQNALLAGLFTAEGDVLVSIDADLQDDISVLPNMLTHFEQGTDIVYGVRTDRARDSLFKRVTARAFYRAMRLMGAESIYNHADFRLMSRRAVDGLKEFGEVNLFLRGMVPLLGFSSAIVEYARAERFAGVSKYSLRKMIGFALEAITSFSVVPLRLITFAGIVVFFLSLSVVAWALWARFFTDRAIPGWTSTVLPIYLLGGLQILSVGVVGEYIGKLYQEAKARPRFIIEKRVGC
jgi:glycosyltransferase involved in cell wall biosynthesis